MRTLSKDGGLKTQCWICGVSVGAKEFGWSESRREEVGCVFDCDVIDSLGIFKLPWNTLFGCALYNTCPCCDRGFGYDDSTVAHADLREKGVRRGANISPRLIT
jgi:hypothetical protein